MCLYNRPIKNKKFEPNKKNGGLVPPIYDKRTQLVNTGCGKCIECRKKKTNNWIVRLSEEIKANPNGIFVTLTFSNQKYAYWYKKIKQQYNNQLTPYGLDNEIATQATRRFLESWRKEHKKSIKHWLITELGHTGTENLHLHGILWTTEPVEKINKHWKNGYIWSGNKNYITGKSEQYVNMKTINYITKYINKIDQDHKGYESKILASPGIGKHYMERTDHYKNQFNGTETNEAYKTESGHKIALPTYYRNKIYNEDQREKLWIQHLNKDETIIMGIPIKNQNIDEYNASIQEARKNNKQLGYGNRRLSWEVLDQEQAKRIQKQLQRLKNQQHEI